ncbi:hypothetical protein DM860_004898 [Cuscuta australis]|nr:hypothetical protein DM860_004898 [Cuscuta australis]
MDCDGCERKVRNAIRRIKGVKSIDVNRKQSKVTVNGFVEPNKVLRNVKRTGKRAEFWPYIPCSAVYNPSAVYDRRAPPGHVKNAQQAILPPQATDQRLAYFFSDDNPNACSIM